MYEKEGIQIAFPQALAHVANRDRRMMPIFDKKWLRECLQNIEAINNTMLEHILRRTWINLIDHTPVFATE